MNIFYKIFSGLLLLIYWLFVSKTALKILKKTRYIIFIILWLLFIYMIPILGIVAYFAFSQSYFGKKRTKRARKMYPYINQWITDIKCYPHIFSNNYSDIASPLFKLCENRQGINGIIGNKIQIINNFTDIIQSIIQDIQHANHNIEMIFYIWKPGGRVDEIAKSLIAASQRGIYCRIMLDSVGSISFFRSCWPVIMRQAGIEVVEVLKLSIRSFFFRRIDLRQHRKMILVDNYIAYTGSMNLVDPKLFKHNIGIGQWVDIMVRIEGPISTLMSFVYSCDWEIETGKRILAPSLGNNMVIASCEKELIIQLIGSGLNFPEDMIHQSLLTIIYSARKQLVITTPYFIPSNDIIYAICAAAMRGVNVIIILPLYNDSIFVKWASRVFFSELLEAGVKIYQYEKGFLHTKTIIVDEQLSILGTINIDMRSLWINLEIALVIDNTVFSKQLAKIQQDYISCSQQLDIHLWYKRRWWKYIIEQFFYFFGPLL
ncbi:cardiolipin synthase [Candidatus Ishikawella capsulata]|nr:cardiolipin synthase [Candidatus Ishikawaella capsulata]